jgi:hypothetical protein
MKSNYNCSNCGYGLLLKAHSKKCATPKNIKCCRYPASVFKYHAQWCGEHKTKGEVKLAKETSISRVKIAYNGKEE